MYNFVKKNLFYLLVGGYLLGLVISFGVCAAATQIADQSPGGFHYDLYIDRNPELAKHSGRIDPGCIFAAMIWPLFWPGYVVYHFTYLAMGGE